MTRSATAPGYLLTDFDPRAPGSVAFDDGPNLPAAIAEDTIASLGQIDPEHVGVIGRTSIMAYKRTTKSLVEIGHELGADYLVESSLRNAEAAFRRAIALDPSYARAHVVRGHVLSQMGRQSEAETVMRQARELEPLNAMVHAMSSQGAFQGRDYPAAVEHARQAFASKAPHE